MVVVYKVQYILFYFCGEMKNHFGVFNELEKHELKVAWTRNAMKTLFSVCVNCFFIVFIYLFIFFYLGDFAYNMESVSKKTLGDNFNEILITDNLSAVNYHYRVEWPNLVCSSKLAGLVL